MTDVMAPPRLTERVAGEILAILGRRRISQAELARRLGQGPMWVSDRLRGVQQIGLDDLARIADALGEDPVALLAPGKRDTYWYPAMSESAPESVRSSDGVPERHVVDPRPRIVRRPRFATVHPVG